MNHVQFSKLGGMAKSRKKTLASRKNWKKAVQAIRKKKMLNLSKTKKAH